MATQLTIVNNILDRLREDTVSTVNETSYSKLIARFVTDAIDDIEEIDTAWEQYRTVYDISILTDGTLVYDLSGSNDRTWIGKSFNNSEIPLAFDITSGEKGQLYLIPRSIFDEVQNIQTGSTEAAPRSFTTSFDDSTGELQIELLWGSSTARTWRIVTFTPQAELAYDGTDDATNIKLPRRPVELRALYYALNERGEEMGEPGGLAWQRSERAIAAALENNREILRRWEDSQFTNQETL